MEPTEQSVKTPKECDRHDGDRIGKDVNGHWFNLARCKLVDCSDDGNTEYCDEIRAFGNCPKGLK